MHPLGRLVQAQLSQRHVSRHPRGGAVGRGSLCIHRPCVRGGEGGETGGWVVLVWLREGECVRAPRPSALRAHRS